MSTTQADTDEFELLSNYLEREEVQTYLEAKNLEPSEVEWFAQSQLKDSWHEDFSDAALFVTAVQYLTGTHDGQIGAFAIRGDDELKSEWTVMKDHLRENGPFTKTMMKYTRRIHALKDDDGVKQRLVLALAAYYTESEIGEDPGWKGAKQICYRYDTNYNKLAQFKEQYERRIKNNTYPETEDLKRLPSFLKDDRVQEFLDREDLKAEDVEWFTQEFIEMHWQANAGKNATEMDLLGSAGEDVTGVVALMILTGRERKAGRYRGKYDGCDALIGYLGYEPEEIEGWKGLYNKLTRRSYFAPQMLNEISRVRAFSETNDSRPILATAEILARGAEDDDSVWDEIIERYETDVDRVKAVLSSVNRGDDE